MSQTSNDSEKLAKRYRKYVLVYRITGATYKTLLSIFRRSSPPSREKGKVPHSFAALVSLIFTIITGLLILLVGGEAALQETILVVVALGVVFFLTLRQAEMVGRRVIDTLLTKMSPPVHNPQVWFEISENIKGQFWAAAIVALICIPLEIAVLRQTLIHMSAIWPIVAFTSVEIWVLSSSAYMGIFSSRNFVDLLNEHFDLNLYPFDPAHSPILQPIAGLFAGVMFDQAILGIIVVMSFFVIKPNTVVTTIGTAILVFVVLMLVGNFVYAQLKLATLISQTKRKTIKELQEKIIKIYKSDTEADQTAEGFDGGKELSKLLNLYEKVNKSSNFAIDIESLSTYLSGVVWSLVSILTVNLPVPRYLVDNVSQLLGEFSQFIVQFMVAGF